MDPTSGGIGAAVAAVGGLLYAWLTKGSRRAAIANEIASTTAETGVIETLREEVNRLSARLTNLEARCDRQARRIWQLEAELARHGMPVPAEIVPE